MDKGVTVKKCKQHRYAIRFFAVLFAAFPIIIILNTQQLLFALIGMIPFLLFFPVMLYYETWQISFTAKGIEKSVFFRKPKSYSYVQLQKATKGYCSSKSDIILRMIFTDGKAIQFRKDDENAQKAEQQLQKHCSIISIS